MEKRIVIIGSDSEYENSLKSEFKEKKYTVDIFKNLEDINMLKDQKIDLLIVNDEFEYYEFVEFIDNYVRKNHPKLEIILLTDESNPRYKKDLLNHGVLDYISKNRSIIDNISYLNTLLNKKERFIGLNVPVKIAIVDDDFNTIQILKILLNSIGLKNIETFNSGEELMESKQDFDIYIIDIIMEGVSGSQLVIWLRQRYKKSIILVNSSLEDSKIISNILASGADDFFQKPINTDFFLSKMRRYVDLCISYKE